VRLCAAAAAGVFTTRNHSMPSRHKAFTLVELLVVIAVIGVLVALLLPAVQAAREAARRIECSNNLKQIGLSLQNYHDVYKQLPAGWIAHAATGEPGWGWATHTLPFLEHGVIYDQISVMLPISHPANLATRQTSLPSYRCPSDSRGSDLMVLLEDEATGSPLFSVARANYVGLFGTLEIEDDPFAGNGVFYQNSRVRFADILDGLSTTLVVGERCSHLAGSTWTGAVEGAAEGMARIVGSTDHAPNDPAAHFDDFSSDHTTGANFVRADGSVRLIANSIDHAVYQALATRAGGEAASSGE
jgi:prepilin-type N-terminal cleavage/methylation domain-containing protein